MFVSGIDAIDVDVLEDIFGMSESAEFVLGNSLTWVSCQVLKRLVGSFLASKFQKEFI